jgi:hypothetical protein
VKCGAVVEVKKDVVSDREELKEKFKGLCKVITELLGGC